MNKLFYPSLLLLLFAARIQAQAPIDGYANTDNNIYRIPRLFIGLMPLGVQMDAGITPVAEFHIKYRSDAFGELQLSGVSDYMFTRTSQALPFGSSVRCSTCPDFNNARIEQVELSYTYYLSKKEKQANYRYAVQGVRVKGEEGPGFGWPVYEEHKGLKQHLWGLRIGGQSLSRDLYLMNRGRSLGYTDLNQISAFLGLSYTTLGRLYRNTDNNGIRGKNINHQLYIDAFYALTQNAQALQAQLFDISGAPIKPVKNYIPYGIRAGVISYKYPYSSPLAFTIRLEGGFNPSLEDIGNGFYATVRLGFGFGSVRTPVNAVTRHQQKLNSQSPHPQGNGKYRERSPWGKKLHKRKPLKAIPHRFS